MCACLFCVWILIIIRFGCLIILVFVFLFWVYVRVSLVLVYVFVYVFGFDGLLLASCLWFALGVM